MQREVQDLKSQIQEKSAYSIKLQREVYICVLASFNILL